MYGHDFRSIATRFLVILVCAGALSAPVLAQEHPEPAGTPLPPGAQVFQAPRGDGVLGGARLSENGLYNILVTGYWPPSNDMLRPFSPHPEQNPGGWVGENWEGRGYNIYSFFPEFPYGLGKGEGDLEVDYQDTSADFWPIAATIQPLAVITTGRAGVTYYWEVETRTRNLPQSPWGNDYLAPLKPTPAPPDGDNPAWFERESSLPIWEIAQAVNDAGLGVTAFVDISDYCGAFLCEYIAYHGMWYHDERVDPDLPDWCLAAGHIHVGSLVSTSQAVQATEVTLRTLIAYLDAQRVYPGDLNCDGVISFDDINPFVLAISDQAGYDLAYPGCPNANGDINYDGSINFDDINSFVSLLGGG